MALNKKILAFLFLGGMAGGAGASFASDLCVSGPSLRPPSQRCEDNVIFIQEGEVCLQRLKNLVQEETEKLKKKFSKGAIGAQDQKFSDTSFDRKQALERLDALKAANRNAIITVNSYLDNVYFPVDFDHPAVNRGNMDAYVMSEPCYGKTVQAIDSILKDMENIMMDVLELEREIKAQKLSVDTSGKNLKNIVDPGTLGVQGLGKGAPAGATPPAPGIRKSDVSGTKDTTKPKNKK